MVIQVVVKRIRKTLKTGSLHQYPSKTKVVGTAQSVGSSRLGDDIAFYSRYPVEIGTEGILGGFIEIGSGRMSKKSHGHSRIHELIPNE